MSNAFTCEIAKKKARHSIPGYDAYSAAFAACDKFNAGLAGHTFPHRHGGGTSYGEKQAVHDFCFSSLLQNVTAAYTKCTGRDTTYLAACVALADELFEFSATLPH